MYTVLIWGFLQGGLWWLWGSTVRCCPGEGLSCSPAPIFGEELVYKTMTTKFVTSTSILLWCLYHQHYNVPPQGWWSADALLLGPRCPPYLGDAVFPRQNTSLLKSLNSLLKALNLLPGMSMRIYRAFASWDPTNITSCHLCDWNKTAAAVAFF